MLSKPQNENTAIEQKANKAAKQVGKVIGNVTFNEFKNPLPPADDKPVKKSGYFYERPMKKPFLLAAFVALICVVVIYIIWKPPKPPESPENPLWFSNIEEAENGKNSIVFKAPKMLHRAWMMNTGEEPLTISIKSFPERFFYISLLDDGFVKLDPGIEEKKAFSVVVKTDTNPDDSEYSFTINYDFNRSTPIQLKLEGNWGDFYLPMAKKLERQVSKNDSISEFHEAAVGIVAKTYPRAKPHIQQIVAGQLLSREAHFKAATIAYKKAKKLNPRISGNRSFKLMLESARNNDAQSKPTNDEQPNSISTAWNNDAQPKPTARNNDEQSEPTARFNDEQPEPTVWDNDLQSGAIFAGEVFRDRLKDGSLGPEMVQISAGTFRMGDIQGGGWKDEQPVHSVSVNKFAMGRYEVTFAEYDQFVQATGREEPSDQGWGRDNRPVINVSWNDATAYTEWLSEQTGQTYRLPTEAEWEYAARAGSDTKYWWGNDIGFNKANCRKSYCGDDFEYTAPVGSFAANAFGLYDTVGNVWEWTCSEYENRYKGKEKHCLSKNRANNRGPFVLRGGSWDGSAGGARSTDRSRGSRTNRNGFRGFRLARLF
jgi:formylglycine-generating enzyme required for sulfatase activity